VCARTTDIRLQQRNGRKTLTTVQGLNTYLDSGKIEKLIKIFKKARGRTPSVCAYGAAFVLTGAPGWCGAAYSQEFSCNGTIVDHKEWGEVIQLQGDHRVRISELLAEEGLVKKDNIKVHGF
jgi:translation initiation factor 1